LAINHLCLLQVAADYYKTSKTNFQISISSFYFGLRKRNRTYLKLGIRHFEYTKPGK